LETYFGRSERSTVNGCFSDETNLNKEKRRPMTNSSREAKNRLPESSDRPCQASIE
jgi:hypothetical protein